MPGILNFRFEFSSQSTHIYFQPQQGLCAFTLPGPEDGGPHLQRGRYELLLQRPRGVRSGKNEKITPL